MDVRQSIHSAHAKTLDTQGLRNEFLVEKVFVADEYTMVYSHIDRIIVGGIFFFSSRRRHTRSVSAFLLNRSSDLHV